MAPIASILSSYKSGATGLLASHEGHADVVKRLLRARAAVDAVNRRGATALVVAGGEGHLLVAGAKVDAADSFGHTALVLAGQRPYEAAVRELLAVGANVEAADPKGWTPLILASDKGYEDVVKELLAAGANPNAAAHRGSSALIRAALNGHERVRRGQRERCQCRGALLSVAPAALTTRAS
ncbi:Ankyrin-like protein [Diplonema papillatum]|nr:Ankyrin-like protein [Diplonema papillatum]KAJ9459983.1 Ankyrin-like protein [Diplonema papillatum]